VVVRLRPDRHLDEQTLGAANGIDCSVIAQPGRHDWPFASRVFAAALPWLAGALHTPGDPVVPLQTPGPTLSAAAAGPAPGGVHTRTQASGR